MLLVVATLGAGVHLLRSGGAEPVIPESIRQILAEQDKLPQTEVETLQALRVVAAVEMAFFTQHGRYAAPEELKSSGFLDPAWPRIDSQAYQISCELGQEGLGLECFADPAPPYSNYYYVNPSKSFVLRRIAGPTRTVRCLE